VRAAKLEDIPAILEIARVCAEAPHWNEGTWSQVFAAHEFRGLQRRCFVAQRTDELVGFVVVSVIAAVEGGGLAEMESLAVNEAARRQGAGRSLCMKAVFWAQSCGAESIQLEVRANSKPALALYRSLGFAERGRRSGYYAAPPDDALLMELCLRKRNEQGQKV